MDVERNAWQRRSGSAFDHDPLREARAADATHAAMADRRRWRVLSGGLVVVAVAVVVVALVAAL